MQLIIQHSSPGTWIGTLDSRHIFNVDETPQFINYGSAGTKSSLVYAPKGEECQLMIHEICEFSAVPVFCLNLNNIDKS